MVKENNYEVIWTLLKGDILKALADVIGADGRPFINDDITANTPWADESQRSPRPAHHQRASPQVRLLTWSKYGLGWIGYRFRAYRRV